MESGKIEILLEKYFEGTASVAEENTLRAYFSLSDVAPHLEHYKNLFGYFVSAKQQSYKYEIPLQTKKVKMPWSWLSIAMVIVFLFGVYFFYKYDKSQDVDTFNDPEVAFKETQKALSMLSQNVNIGIESVQHIEEYQNTKNLIFKP